MEGKKGRKDGEGILSAACSHGWMKGGSFVVRKIHGEGKMGGQGGKIGGMGVLGAGMPGWRETKP